MGTRPGRQDLPHDIVYEILIRLAVKTLTRFCSVSKSWYSLISKPSFQKDHYRRSQHHPLLLRIHTDTNDDDRDILTLKFSTHNSIGRSIINEFSKTVPKTDKQINDYLPIQSCHGLVCLESFAEVGYTLLCNPSTEELITEPVPWVGYNAIFGFGYSASMEEFKVVRYFTREIDDRNYCCEVYTVGNSGWREARRPPPYQPQCGITFFHGALHLMPEPAIGYQLLDHYYIAAFDMDTEEYREVPFPEIYFGKASSIPSECTELLELGGSLSLTLDYSEISEEMLEIWFLKDYDNGKWVKEYSIDLSTLTSDVFASPVAIMGDGSILMNVFEEEGHEVRCYNTEERCFEPPMEWNCWFTHYKESFFTLGSRCPLKRTTICNH